MGCAPACRSGLDPSPKASNHWCFRAQAKMIEIGIISIIVLAVGYWVTLWLMGRHDDVLHGDFVHGEPGAETAALPDQPFPDRPPFPAKPVFPAKPMPAAKPVSAMKPMSVVKPMSAAKLSGKAAALKAAVAKAAVAKAAAAQGLPAGPLPSSAPVPVSERLDTLQSLLASIKRDLKDASQL